MTNAAVISGIRDIDCDVCRGDSRIKVKSCFIQIGLPSIAFTPSRFRPLAQVCAMTSFAHADQQGDEN
eukprot:765521-Hanusia_phi.AAC.10